MDIIQFGDIKRCPLCGKPTTEKHATTGEYVHAQCAKDDEQFWNERDAEKAYRARPAPATYPCWTDLGNWVPCDLDRDSPTREDLIRSCLLHECSEEWLAIQLKVSLTEVKKILASMMKEYRRSERTFTREQRRYLGCIYKLAFRLCFFRVMDVPPFELVAPGAKLKKTLSKVQEAHFSGVRYGWEKSS